MRHRIYLSGEMRPVGYTFLPKAGSRQEQIVHIAIRIAVVLCLVLATGTRQTWSQPSEYPARPIHFITSSPAGGAVDLTARIIGQHLGKALGQPVVIDARPGASGLIAAGAVAKAAPDGYTLLIAVSSLAVNPHIQKNIPYDVASDFASIIHITTYSFVMVVNRDVPAASVQDLIALAKANPGTLNFASAGNGSPPHLAGELFKAATGVNLVHVPYSGSPAAVVALLAGQTQIMLDGMPSILAYIKSGRLRPLAAASAGRNSLLPDLPTFAELGHKEINVGLWIGLLAPARTPTAVVSKLNAEINRILETPEVRDNFLAQGADLIGGTPAQFAEFMQKEQVRWGPVIKSIGLKVD
jgi:tripartite-type tricarboxylate transporter receptor subunit TctC